MLQPDAPTLCTFAEMGKMDISATVRGTPPAPSHESDSLKGFIPDDLTCGSARREKGGDVIGNRSQTPLEARGAAGTISIPAKRNSDELSGFFCSLVV